MFEQIELQAKLLNYFLGSNKSNINQINKTDTTCQQVNLGMVVYLSSVYTLHVGTRHHHHIVMCLKYHVKHISK